MFGCYRKQEANDPEIYVAAVTAVLSEYPQPVIETVTDPRSGLPSRLKWLPSVAEVREECERYMWPLRFREAEAKKLREQRADNTPKRTAGETQRVGDGLKDLVEKLRAGIGPSTAS